MNTITVTETLTKMCCWKCGITFAIPERFQRTCQDKGHSWFCPHGHEAIYTETRVQKLERKLNQEIASHDRTRTILTHSRERTSDAKRRVAAQKGVATKLRKRASAGACPCCNRSFTNLQRHMKTKHPNYSESGKD